MARTATRRTAAESITRYLTGRKRPVTADAIADATGLNLNTTRTTLGLLTGSGLVAFVGRDAPSFGRPSNLYKLAA